MWVGGWWEGRWARGRVCVVGVGLGWQHHANQITTLPPGKFLFSSSFFPNHLMPSCLGREREKVGVVGREGMAGFMGSCRASCPACLSQKHVASHAVAWPHCTQACCLLTPCLPMPHGMFGIHTSAARPEHAATCQCCPSHTPKVPGSFIVVLW